MMKMIFIKGWVFCVIIGMSGLVLRTFDSIPYFTKPFQEAAENSIEYIVKSYGETWNSMSVVQRMEATELGIIDFIEMNKKRKDIHKKEYDKLWTQLSVLFVVFGLFVNLFSKKRSEMANKNECSIQGD